MSRAMNPSTDLPLMANSDVIRVRHYVLDLAVHFEMHTFSGSVTLFLEQPQDKREGESISGRRNGRLDSKGSYATDSKGNFVLILDSCDITVESAHEIISNKSSRKDSSSSQSTGRKDRRLSSTSGNLEATQNSSRVSPENGDYQEDGSSSRLGQALQFSMEPWCLKVWKEGVRSPEDFPGAVLIKYSTKSQGRSLMWAYDQAGNECVFTPGAWINNRSLFPCQEPPGALATWQAKIRTPKEFVVLMSGDDEAITSPEQNGLVSHRYQSTSMPMPCSVLALAIGQWKSVNIPQVQGQPPANTGDSSPSTLPSRLFAPASILHFVEAEFARLLPRYLATSYEVLGAHPFRRLDVLVLPKCFASLGLASPSLIFVSQTLLPGDHSFCPRLAHEITHAWFGLLIGAEDWTEEWLSEGFATFLEDPIHGLAEKLSEKQFKDWSNLKALIRFKVLQQEVRNTSADLQIMRPMAGDSTMNHAGTGTNKPAYVKNGMNQDKWFQQVHYLKGYFLLQHLSLKVGSSQLLRFIRSYVNRFRGQLVLTQQFINMLFETFPQLQDNGLSPEVVSSEWLDCAGMPSALRPETFSWDNNLVQQVEAECNRWLAVDKANRHGGKPQKRKHTGALLAKLTDPSNQNWAKLSPDQLVLLMEVLIESGHRLTAKTMQQLKETYGLVKQNAEVRHRWCEMVIRNRYVDGYGDIRIFLLEEQSMGVYLYGELIATRDPVQRLVAEACLQAVEDEMDPGCLVKVQKMFFGET
ncbi:aminopeptidase O-like [Acanthaster planci]|uniref:Aminopeptidase O-like n=1 Tax=Acanthaster planci TaxID=133434 RepID=A0A8B7ZCT0_ACAPL|nr:aminopeptidase O-like [Acanthaster planci]